MADRNTKIRGSQILDATITEDEMASTAFGDGLTGGSGSVIEVQAVANEGIAVGAGGIQVDYDDATIGMVANKLAVLDDSIAEVKLDIHNAPVDGYYMKWTTANGMVWADVSAGYVKLTDMISNEAPSGDINGVNTSYTLANTPASGTVEVILNGLQQEPGSGKDYTISGDTITFAVAPDTGDILLANYVKT